VQPVPQHTQPVQPQPPANQPQVRPNQIQPTQPQVRQNPNQPGPTTTHQRPPQPPQLPALTATQATPLQKHNGPAALVPTNQQGHPINTVAGLHSERHEAVVNGQTVITEGHRVIVRDPNGAMVIRHDDVDRFRYGARDVRIERRGNDNVTTVVLGNGSRVVTTLGPDGRILRRSRFDRDGREIVLIAAAAVVGVSLFVELPPPVIRIPRDRYVVDLEAAPPDYVYDAFTAPPVEQVDQPYSLDQVLDSPSLRDLMPSVDIDTLTFETGSWEVGPDQVDRLQVIADNINRVISANPKEVFLIEGHTDAVGNDVDNMSLSDRRAETVALILSDKFGVPPENLVTQGYGSQFLRDQTPGPDRRNRRVTVRRITPLLAGR
jgi:outer membrane protein OmpA-like peptidoglycan-associated protein